MAKSYGLADQKFCSFQMSLNIGKSRKQDLRTFVESLVNAYKAWVRAQLSLCSNFKVFLRLDSVWKIKSGTLAWQVETMKISEFPNLLQKVYQNEFIELWNFILSWVEHEKSITCTGPGVLIGEKHFDFEYNMENLYM